MGQGHGPKSHSGEDSAELELWMEGSSAIDPRAVRRFHAALVKLVVADFQPLTVVEDEGFRSLIQAVDRRFVPLIPTPKTLRAHVRVEAELVREKLRETLRREATFVAVVADGWSSKVVESYEGCHVHYIDNDWNLQSRTLGASADDLYAFVKGLLAKYGIPSSRICAFVSDTAANIRSALHKFEKPAFPCIAHVLALVVKDALAAAAEIISMIESVRKVVNHFKHSPAAYKLLHEIQKKMAIPECALIMDNDTRWNSTLRMLRRFQELMVPLLTWAKGAIGDIGSAVTHLDFSLLAPVIASLEPFEEATLKLESEKTPTFSIVWPLVRGVLLELYNLERKKYVEGPQEAQDVEAETAAEDEPESVTSLPRDEANQFGGAVSGDSSGSIAAQPDVLMHFGSDNDLPPTREVLGVVNSFRQNLRVSLLSRWTTAWNANGWRYACGCALDPRWKYFLCTKEVMKRAIVKGALWCAEMLADGSEIRPAAAAGMQTTSTATEEGLQPPQKKANVSLLEKVRQNATMGQSDQETETRAHKTPTEIRAQAELEVEKYFALPVAALSENPLAWWRKHAVLYPLLADLVRLILCIPAEDSAMERDFSAAGYFVSDRRARLRPALVDDMLLMHGNADLRSGFGDADDHWSQRRARPLGQKWDSKRRPRHQYHRRRIGIGAKGL